jgi:hypothetical protein
VELWTITEPGTMLANDFYFSRAEAEAALEDARRDTWHVDDAAAFAMLRVERIKLQAESSSN